MWEVGGILSELSLRVDGLDERGRKQCGGIRSAAIFKMEVNGGVPTTSQLSLAHWVISHDRRHHTPHTCQRPLYVLLWRIDREI